ncbi:threonine-phosphate decarboxylase CobD [Clostridium paraputrificum]|uniref:threonine-phosphate decarboxylase CobD n=1 Tax=Clostridium TaxID=1485 RepID=UPI003D34E365
MNLGHGGNVEEISRKYNIEEESIIDFSANINPLGLSKKVKEEMIKALEKIERYPDITYHELKAGISKYEGVKEENILLGNGAAEVIFNIVRGLKPKKVLLPAPTFSEYAEAVESINSEVINYKLGDNFTLDEEFIDLVNEDIDMIFICNPNNPTGVLTKKEYLEKLIKKSRKSNTTVVIDESFLDFIENNKEYSAIDICSEYNNLIVVKSLTKFFAFPGIRIGYGITKNVEYLEAINKVSISWSINTVAAAGAKVAMEQRDYIKETIEFVKLEKRFLFNSISEFRELMVYEGAVNFIFFKVNLDIDLRELLLREGILVRSCNNYVGLDRNFYRIAVRTREENSRLIEALRKVFKK